MAVEVVLVHTSDDSRWNGEDEVLVETMKPVARYELGTLTVEQQGFVDWWVRVQMGDLRATLPKMVEYGGVEGQEGSADLIVMGDAQAELMGHHDMESPWKQALACWFYLLGKVARMVSNFKRREWPKEDTVHDARVYLMMMQSLRDRGRWP